MRDTSPNQDLSPELSPEMAFKILGKPELSVKQASLNEGDYLFTDRNATFCSFITAHVKQAEESVLQSCRDHADFWGVRDECEQALNKLAEWEPPQVPEEAYALVKQAGDRMIQKYAAFDKESAVEAAIAFHENKAKYPLSWRKEAAVRLLSRAERYGAILPEYVENSLYKSAGLGYPTSESIENLMVNRLNHVKQGQDELGERLGILMEHMIDDAQLRYDDDFVKQAMFAVEEFDASLGLTNHYGCGVDFPEDFLENTTNQLEKLAGISKQAVSLVNGKTVDVTQLSKEALAAVDPQLSKMAEEDLIDILPTLPKGDADLLVRLAE